MLKVENLAKRYATREGTPGGGVFGVSFDIAEGELFTLLGPSGCGKTTTLRSIAGLEEPDGGRIWLGEKAIFEAARGFSVPAYDRDIGMVFQSYAIWPHMTVFENAAYPLRVSRARRLSRTEIGERVKRTLRMVGLEDYAERSATQLSGGQQQRLALARALTREPKLLLLDEPLSNLDAQLREQMRAELQRLQKEWGVTTLYVTHDQSEALALSDRIAVMNRGVIVQVAPPREIYARPATEFVAGFIGKTNLIHGDVHAATPADGLGRVETPLGALTCLFTAAIAAGARMAVVVRPESIEIAASGASSGGAEGNRIQGTVRREIYLGEIVEYDVACAGGVTLAVRTAPGKRIAVEDAVTLHLPTDKTIALIPVEAAPASVA